MKKVLAGLLVAAMSLSLFACQGNAAKPEETKAETKMEEKKAEENGAKIVFDDYGRQVTLEARPTKVVTSAPNTTELMVALGLGEYVVGTSYHNHSRGPLPEYEEVMNKIPEITHSAPTMEAVVGSGADFVYGIDWTFEGDFTVETLAEHGIQVMTNAASNMDELYKEITTLGEIFGVQDRAKKLIEDQQKRIAAVQEKIKGQEPKKVLVYDSISGKGIFTAGKKNIFDQLIRLAGGNNFVTIEDKAWTNISIEEAVKEDPDFIIITDYETPTADEKIAGIKNDPIMSNLHAVKDDHFLVIPLEAAFPSARAALVVETIAKTLYPDLFK